MTTGQSSQSVPRGMNPALLFLLCCMWIAVSLAGGRLAAALTPEPWGEAARFASTAAMLFGGFYLAARLGVPDLRPLSSVGFVRRPTAKREFGMGLALGWGTGLALLLPALFSRSLSFRFRLNGPGFRDSLIALALVCSFTLVLQLIVSGLPVRLLVRSVGAGWTVTVVTLLGVLLLLPGRVVEGRGVIYTALALCLFLVGFLRTRATWLPMGLQAGLMGSLMLLFGAPSPYLSSPPGLVRSDVTGPAWLTGGFAGPEASGIAAFILLIALPVLVRMTKDFAWHYTYQPGVPAGFPMEVQPPAEHTRQVQNTPVESHLVQIGGTTPDLSPAKTTES